ncbi:hypothetical protein [Aquisediminimonas profunda]|uniref:hypothetical protein n=1 Tax=Aquisediminimonas profunda TaxID=1550733 RepID=UPI001C630EBD|nr:hypothetical protein [Aquisediminimonas profunda]
MRKSVLRSASIDWIANLGCSHALTLNPNRDVTEEKLKKMFRAFCLEVDRYCFGRKTVHKLAPDDRFLAFAFTEHLNSNPHIHAVCRLDGWLPAALSLDDQAAFAACWKKITRGPGSLWFEGCFDTAGWIEYITKEFYRPDHQYILSTGFHPH